jgi:outer membrane protein TolC
MEKLNRLKIYFSFFIFHFSFFIAVGQPDSLSRYLKIAAENNPAVRAAFHTYKASLQKIPQMGAYEDPQLEMGFFLEPMDIIGGREIAQFQLMQMFPWFGTKKAAQTEAQHMAQMAFEQFREARDNLYLDIHTQWYIVCSLQQKQINSEENLKLLQQLEELALRRFASGDVTTQVKSEGRKVKGEGESVQNRGGMSMGSSAAPVSGNMENMAGGTTMGGSSSGMSEVLRIQLEIMEMESAIAGIRSEITATKARFNALLNRPPASEVVVPEELVQAFYLLDIQTVMNRITEQNPMLGMIREEIAAYEAKQKMDKKMGYPMFGIGLQYMWIGKEKTNSANESMDMDNTNSTTMSGMNGKDMIMPMVSVSIPIFRNKYKARQKESQWLTSAGEEKYANTRNLLEAELFQYKHQLEDAQRKITLYKKQSELARTTCELVIREFATGKSDLSAVIQVQRQLLEYELKQSDAIAVYNTMVANIQKLISMEL